MASYLDKIKTGQIRIEEMQAKLLTLQKKGKLSDLDKSLLRGFLYKPKFTQKALEIKRELKDELSQELKLKVVGTLITGPRPDTLDETFELFQHQTELVMKDLPRPLY